MDDMALIYTTWPDAETAEQAAQTVVAEGLAACANIAPGMVSIYRWKGAVERASEAVMILKTPLKAAPALRDRLAQMHPYEVPCIVALPLAAAQSSPEFLAWVAEQTAQAS